MNTYLTAAFVVPLVVTAPEFPRKAGPERETAKHISQSYPLAREMRIDFVVHR